jgi:hypothetical protein
MASRAEPLNIEHPYIAGALASFRKAKDPSMAYRSYQENASTKFPALYQERSLLAGQYHHELLYHTSRQDAKYLLTMPLRSDYVLALAFGSLSILDSEAYQKSDPPRLSSARCVPLYWLGRLIDPYFHTQTKETNIWL